MRKKAFASRAPPRSTRKAHKESPGVLVKFKEGTLGQKWVQRKENERVKKGKIREGKLGQDREKDKVPYLHFFCFHLYTFNFISHCSIS